MNDIQLSFFGMFTVGFAAEVASSPARSGGLNLRRFSSLPRSPGEFAAVPSCEPAVAEPADGLPARPEVVF